MSLIIPVFNVENFLDKCLTSILISTQNEIEVLLVDDYSKDRSLEISYMYCDLDMRVRVIENNESRLAGYCRNLGINTAIGEYVWFIDADDWLENLAIDRIIESTRDDTETDIFTFGYSVYLSSESEYERRQKKCLIKKENDPLEGFLQLKEGYTPMPFSYVFRREFLLSNKILFPEDVYYEDLFFMASSFYYAKGVKIIPANLYVYNRTRLDSISHSHSNKKIIDFLYNYQLVRNFLIEVNADNHYLKLLNFRFIVSGLPRCIRMYLALKINSCSDKRLWKTLNSYCSKRNLSILSLINHKKHVDFLFHDDPNRRAELIKNLRFLFFVKYAFKLILLRTLWMKILLDKQY